MAKKQRQVKITRAPKSVIARRSRATMLPSRVLSDSPRHLIVRGTVSHPDKSPAVGLTVVAFDKDVQGEDRLGHATTDAKGGYHITYSVAQFRRSSSERGGADVFVRIQDANDELLFQSKTVRSAPADLLLDVSLPAAQFAVRGQVRLADGNPVAGALVRVYDKDLRSKELLGRSKQVTTDKEGRYEITYTAEQFARAEKRSADLLVEARPNHEKDWTAAPIRFNAEPVEIVDVTLGVAHRGPSEFRRLVDEITPLLDGLRMSQLTENSEFQDITFLSNEAGIDGQLVARLAVSALRAEEEDLLRHEEYYGLFRQDLPMDLDTLLARSIDTLRGALDKSARDNVVGPLSERDLADFVSRVQKLKARRALHSSGENKPASLGDLLAVAVDAGKRERIATVYVEHGGATDAFWKALEKNSSLKPDDVKAAKQLLALGTFTDNYLPLVRELYRMGEDKAAFADLRGFAQLDETEWRAVLQRTQGPEGQNGKPIGIPPGQESIESYARTLNQFIENAFPTAVIANRLERDDSDDSPFKGAKSDLLTFFSNNPEFSFAETPPNFYLSEGASEKLRDIENPDALKAQLKDMQRVFNITPRFPEIRALIADDLHSATAIVQVGGRKFAEKYAEAFGGKSKARESFSNAEHVHAKAQTLFLKHASASNSPLPYVIGGGVTEIPVARNVDVAIRSSAFVIGSSAAHMAPDYSTLFGSLDVCDCEHCQSVYSPAAYFVDILKFLDGGPKTDDKSPLQVLLERRPDIEHIELTCENTNTELPYIDLINEILEAGIVPRSFEIAENSDALAALDAGGISLWMRMVFADHGYALTNEASLRKEAVAGVIVGSKWIILDAGWAFTLKHQGTNEGFLVIAWPQTSWTSDELRANPEHIQAPAYDVLRGAVYPWNLPLNLPLEEVRVYLGNLGVKRQDLMETLFPGTASDAVSDRGIALEYLGLDTKEADIISGVTTGGPAGTPFPAGAWDFWGLRDTGNDIVDLTDGTAPRARGDWDVALQRVSIFLQQSGLSYKELLELLGTYFINPPASAGTPGGRLLGIVSTDGSDPATCTRSKLEIRVIDDKTASSAKDELIAAWNRIHRFARLWRKLGWTMRDLDKAITALEPGINDGKLDTTTVEAERSDAFLVQLSHIQRLRVETGLPVVNLLGWWADIDTRSYIDQTADREPAVASLYAQLFSNKTVSGQLVGDDPGALTGTLSGKAAAVAAALQISVEDFTLLQAGIPNDGSLTLANLSLVYRHAALAKALKLPIRAYLSALEFVDATPFVTTANTVQFVRRIDELCASAFSIEDLDYLLRNELPPTSDIASPEEVIAIVLDATRDDLRKVSAENTFVEDGVDNSAATSDPHGELTRKKLALLNWDPALIEQVIAVLNDTFTYETKLAALAPGVVFPEPLKSRISYDGTEQALRFTGAMTAADMALLTPPNTDASFVSAVGELFKGPKDFVSRYMARFSMPVFPVAVTAPNLKLLLANLKFPDALKNKIYYDSVAGALSFIGVMTEAERGVLSKLSQDNDYATTIQALFDAPGDVANAPKGVDIFLSATDASGLFADPNDNPQVRFLSVLRRLLPYLQTALNELAVKQRLAEYLKLDTTAIDGLLKQWIAPRVVDAAHPERKAMADFLDPAFAESSPNVRSSKDTFPHQFDALLLLGKVAILILKFNITPRQLQWLFAPKLNAGWLNPNELPLRSPVPAQAMFGGWERLADLFRLRDALPRGEALLADVFATATSPEAQSDPDAQLEKVLEILGNGVQWDLGNLKSLTGANGFNFKVSDFAGESAILRLYAAFAMLKRLGGSADQCLPWTQRPPTGEEALELKSLVRAKYDDAQWLELAKPLRDPLRERQRSALVAYLVQKLGVRGADELHDLYLIDVEMSPCMMTTRIKQAIGSVQLFIQRSLMNLEQDVFLSAEDERDWSREWSQWRKWYRVWEANRKILLYPENWIEPELRDDKSPFYEDLENELLQSDVTMETAEDAFLHYLEKFDQVARLEIVGMYRQQESGDIARQVKRTDIVHVFGRTYAIPHLYFYRRLEDGVWSAWEKVDLDIEGDHLIPVAWNRRLYLFWAIFTEKSEQPTKEQRAAEDDTNTYWEIKLARSEYRNDGWSPKKVSKEWLRQNRYPFWPTDVPQKPPLVVSQEPRDFSFKTRVLQSVDGDQLSIECYGPTVREDQLPPPPPPGPPPALVRFLGALNPHTAFDLSKFKDMPQTTYLKCRFVLDGARLTRAQGAGTTVEIRDAANNLLESITLNSNGVAYSMSGYSAVEQVYVVSSDYEPDSVTREGSWWMPFNPIAYATFVVEACFDAVTDSTGIDVGRTAADIAVVAAVATAIATGGNVGLIIASVVAAVTTAVSGIAGVPNILNVATSAAGKLFGRGMTVKLKLRPAPPAYVPPDPVYKPTPEPMKGVGVFVLDGCNGDLAALQDTQSVQDMTPTQLIPYPNTDIQSMQFVESGESAFITPPPGRGDHILDTTPGTFSLLAPHQDLEFTFQSPFFFQDGQRTYFVSLNESSIGFAIHFHPLVCMLIKALNRDGIPGLLTLENQRTDDHGTGFWRNYGPQPLYIDYASSPKENVDFEYGGAYSLYNWELFFHAPFLIAMRLSKNQRFEDAQKWFHYIFDPTATEALDNIVNPGPERFWRVKPFYDEAMRGVQTLEGLITDASKLEEQVSNWEANPFKPHVIARLRVVAYMKAVVMRYIDNLIEWGDQLFRRDAIESINEATQLYILALQILGRRPESIPARAKAKIQTFRTLDDVEALDKLSDAMVEIESFLAPSVAPASGTGNQSAAPLTMQYFCITGNDKLLGYWDTVADRLFKIRHCMNIEGVERSLPIFEPPIDPGLLVRAAAAGVDIASALNDINAALPHYRFNVMLQKATELCNDIKTLGAAFLAALEKQDAEKLALLRSGHEVELLKAVRGIKEQQISEANNTVQGLLKYQDVVTARQQYYLSRPFMNPYEMGHMDLVGASLIPMGLQVEAEVLAAILHLIPDAKLGFFTTAGTTYGGSNIASALQATGSAAGTTASILNTAGSLNATLGGYQRRQDDWTHQADLATKELKQVEKQIAAAEIRLALSERELENHDLQIENAKEVDEYMRGQKFTNRELYSWMVGQLSGIYFQTYQLAYDVAKRAERAYRHELGLKDSNFIQFGYWDTLKKGLLSGERLYHDLKRMDAAYLDQYKREYEITKHISLIAIDPISLVKLKETGECFVSLPEVLFDLDYPGHYMRRIKSVGLTIPCVTGPYAGVNCTLTQLNSSIRNANTLSGGQYFRHADDTRFSDSFGTIQSIVSSSAQNDSGLFEANMRDERYLPFEGQGAISAWRIQLPKEFKSFDYDTISDVVLHLRYTARDGGEALGQQATTELSNAVNKFIQSEGKQGLARIFSLRHEFPTEWYRFLNPVDTSDGQTMELKFGQDRFPLLFRGRTIGINRADIFLKIEDITDAAVFHGTNNTNHTPLGDYKSLGPLRVGLIPPAASTTTTPTAPIILELSSSDSFLNGLPHGVTNFEPPRNLGGWSLEIQGDDIANIAESLRYKTTVNGVDYWRLKPDLVEDVFIVCRYSV